MPFNSVDHYENFPVASLLLPRRLHRPVQAIYRFARSADDFADEGEADAATRLASLAHYRAELRHIAAQDTPTTPFFRTLADIIKEFRLPLQPFFDLLDAFSQDVVKCRYASFDELLDYCRRSANPVGRLMLHLFDAATPENIGLSDRICSALQLVNFWQDVAIDYQKGRVYLPLEDLAAFGVSEAHIAAGQADRPLRALLGFQVNRASAMLQSGAPLGRRLPGRIGLEIRTTVHAGLRIAEKLRHADYDVFHRRPRLAALDWPLVLARALV